MSTHDFENEWSDYDDGSVTIDYVPPNRRNFNAVSYSRLDQMIERFPAMKNSWEAFIIDYHMCLATILEEEKDQDDDIPF